MIKIISKIANIVLVMIFIVLAILSILFIVLKNGITIEEFSHDQFSIQGLYIKFDKQLILKAENIEIYDDKDTSKPKKGYSAVEIENIIKNFKYIKHYFQEIDLKSLKIEDRDISAKYKDEIFFVDTPFLTIDTKLEKMGNEYQIAVEELKFKDFNVTIAGNGKVDLIDEIYSFDGFFVAYELSGKVDFDIKNYILSYKISSATAESLEQFTIGLKEITPLFDEDISKWIYGKTVANRYLIENFEGLFNLNTFDYMPQTLTGNAVATDAIIRFKDGNPAAIADKIDIKLDKNSLYFTLENPTYEGKDLNGSRVWIDNVIEGDSEIYINIKTNSRLDDTVLKLLKVLGVNLPLKQKSGKLQSDVLVKMVLVNDTTDILGNFKLKDANIDISGASLYSKSATIDLNNSKVKLKNTSLSMDGVFRANGVNGVIDIDKKRANLNAKFQDITIQDLFKRENFSSDVDIDFSTKTTTINVKELKTTLNLAKNTNSINLPNVKGLLAYSPLLKDLGIKSGDISVKTADFKNFDIFAGNVNFDMPFMIDENVSYSKDSFDIKVAKNSVSGRSRSGNLDFDVKNSTIYLNLNGLDLALNLKNDSKSKGFPLIHFNAKNSNIIFNDIGKTLHLSSYSGKLHNKEISFKAKAVPKGDLIFELNKDIIVLNGTNLIGESVNNFLDSNSFSGGKFTIKAVGDKPDDFRAEILMQDTYLTDFVVYQRLLSFINSVPSLLSLKTPDFNDKGFTVKDGKLYFSRKGNNIHIQGMNFLGSSADIAGVGNINLVTGEVNIDLEIIYLKDATSFIDYIPILNQILLGRDRAISTIIEVRGTIKNPTYKTKVTQDVLMTPFNLIKNVLELPVSFFD